MPLSDWEWDIREWQDDRAIYCGATRKSDGRDYRVTLEMPFDDHRFDESARLKTRASMEKCLARQDSHDFVTKESRAVMLDRWTITDRQSGHLWDCNAVRNDGSGECISASGQASDCRMAVEAAIVRRENNGPTGKV